MESLSTLKKDALRALNDTKTLEDLERFEIQFFGRKQGRLTAILRSLAALSEDERRVLGSKANVLRHELEGCLAQKRAELTMQFHRERLKKEKIDITFPGKKVERGHLHPLTQLRREAVGVFTSLGFTVVEGPEIETEYYNFDALNIPKDHPARDMWDTFWLASQNDARSEFLLRTHTSPVQVRYMEHHNPPFRIVAPGKVFRREATDASHDFEFLQLEGLVVGKDISVAHLKHTLLIFFERIFGRMLAVRLRPSYFPFVEPGFEVDITCLTCAGKGCSACKNSGWLEVLGAGMVHPSVFDAAGYAHEEWQGFAFGLGLDRIAMMKYKIPDIRLFRQNDIRFLRQF